MRAFITTLVATSFLAGIAAPVDAAPRDKHKKKYVRYQAQLPKDAESSNWSVPPTRQYDLRVLPFGSQAWWEQSERERGGGASGDGGAGGGGF
jgi:hypothetical protein